MIKFIKEYYKYGQSYVCHKYNLSCSLIWNWLKKYEEKGIEGLKSSTGKHKNPNAGLHLRKPKDKIEEPIILHTDQGSVYSSKSYNKLLKEFNIQRSMSRAGTPTNNPVNESLNDWIKEELFIDFDLKHSKDVPNLIKL